MTQLRLYFYLLVASIAVLLMPSCNKIDDTNVRSQEFIVESPIQTLNRPEPDDRGVITYETYQIVIANGEETISEMANRLDISAEEFALYNGLIPNYRPRNKEVLALHVMLSGDAVQVANGWSNITESELISEDKDLGKEKLSPENNPLRHRIKVGETVYSIARLYNVSVNSLATWNGLGPDLDVKAGREIIIPATIKKIKREQKRPSSEQKETFVETAEPSKKETQKVDENKVSIKTEKKKSIAAPSDIVSVKPFISPVKGKIVSRYSQGKGTNNNNGIDYQTEPLAPVLSAANGTVVLISEIAGGEGNIILIKHSGEMITIYGGLTNLTIEKGEQVNQSQKIGEVVKSSDRSFGLMHFEVRRGMKSIDPEDMIR